MHPGQRRQAGHSARHNDAVSSLLPREGPGIKPSPVGKGTGLDQGVDAPLDALILEIHARACTRGKGTFPECKPSKSTWSRDSVKVSI